MLIDFVLHRYDRYALVKQKLVRKYGQPTELDGFPLGDIGKYYVICYASRNEYRLLMFRYCG